jgi:hypothetical protein
MKPECASWNKGDVAVGCLSAPDCLDRAGKVTLLLLDGSGRSAAARPVGAGRRAGSGEKSVQVAGEIGIPILVV